ncbi:hypothetical protein TL5118_02278 [Thalassovita autumnalis]|uniref:DUF2938 domain-containing protein n=2 Tax=Thalassovita autumnalis TaxID=2072972 RepID=A0A0P1FXZ3_9RHOB|nr:hypothetical protein TL5118_02278 [Thalassovita autumnalis]CUH73976.1 hypothetical protein TL5120_03793 [Thalassovita autumnalis]
MEELWGYGAALGTVATITMDGWEWAEARLLGLPRRNYAMLGRWLGHMTRGTFLHDNIGQAAQIRGEAALGQVAHYGVGVVFGIAFLTFTGFSWLALPEPLAALAFGAVTVVMPLCVMQPAFGFGIAAANLPHPWAARARSLVGHLSFGLGLYLAGLLLRWIA